MNKKLTFFCALFALNFLNCSAQQRLGHQPIDQLDVPAPQPLVEVLLADRQQIPPQLHGGVFVDIDFDTLPIPPLFIDTAQPYHQVRVIYMDNGAPLVEGVDDRLVGERPTLAQTVEQPEAWATYNLQILDEVRWWQIVDWLIQKFRFARQSQKAPAALLCVVNK